jgi:hypothetical protein
MVRCEDGRCVIVIFPPRVYHTVLGRVTLIVSLIQDDLRVYVCMACTAHAQIGFLWETIMDRSSSPQRHCYVCMYVCMYLYS